MIDEHPEEIKLEKAFEKEGLDRIIWSHRSEKGPVVVIFAAIHGNEIASLKASERLLDELGDKAENLKGSIYVISGNRNAIKEGVRFLDRDLNRIWGEVANAENVQVDEKSREWYEAQDILGTISQIIEEHSAPAQDISFLDLHTTSAKSCAFLLFNDTLKNRESATQFPVPQILGIEENIHGTLMSYINDLGYPAIGFEAGNHYDDASIERTEAFLWLYLHYKGIHLLNSSQAAHFKSKVKDFSDVENKYYEISYHQYVEDATLFVMQSGYYNFDRVKKDELLAYYDGEPILAPESGLIFMPLYQNKGNDGFFILKARSSFWLYLSSLFRDSFFNNYLQYLPGVKLENDHVFEVDLKVARFFVKEIFHLLGYRVIKKDDATLTCYKR